MSGNLVVLTADPTMSAVVQILLRERQPALGISINDWEVLTHPFRDSGVISDGHHFLQRYCRTHQYAMVMCDRHGCGIFRARPEIEERLRSDCQQTAGRNAAAPS